MRRTSLLALALCAAALLPGCPSSDRCTPDGEKQLVLGIAQSWYLYPDKLAAVNPRDYASADSMLDALVAPAVAAGVDRGWSFITTTAQQQQYYGEGNSVGFGIGLLVRNSTQLFVSQVYAGSAADGAGFTRGDEILEVGDSEATLTPVSGLITGGTLSQALGPSEAGVTRTFRVAPVANPAAPVVRTVTKGVFSIHPVAYVGTVAAGTAGLPRTVGVVVLRAFISTADAELKGAFASFLSSGIQDVVVDVRYNGGGLISTAELLANLLGGGLSGQTMYDFVNNSAHASSDQRIAFAPPAQAIQPLRLAFVTTGASASASELVPNVLEPHLAPPGTSSSAIALVGAHTYGKPVGQRGFNLTPCNDVLYLISFALENSEGEGGYFSGLPDAAFGGPLCAATDDLQHELGKPGEASTDAALYWMANGTCPPAPLAAARALSIARPDAYPVPARPTVAQVENPGLF